jgi:hypothetical protein
MSYADFSNNLNSYTQYLQGGQSIPLGGGAGFGVKVEMGPGMKRAICNMLAGKGFQPLPDIPICLDLNINQLMGLPGLNAGLMGALGAARDALDAFNEHTGIGPTLARLNAIIAQIAHIANMINFCNEPINPPPIPNFLEDSFGSFLGAGEKILSKLGTVIPDKAAVCYDYRTGQVNIDAYVPDLDSILAEIRALAEEGLAALSFAQLQKWMEALYAIREEFLSLIKKENDLAAGGVEKTAQGFLALGKAADIRVLNPDTLLYPAEQPKINSITFSDDGVPITVLSNSIVKEDAETTQVVEVTFNTPMMDGSITGGADAELVAIVDSAGQVTGLQIRNGGYGYYDAPLIKFTHGNGKGATATCVVDANGTIIKCRVASRGSDYFESGTSTPSVPIVSLIVQQSACGLQISSDANFNSLLPLEQTPVSDPTHKTFRFSYKNLTPDFTYHVRVMNRVRSAGKVENFIRKTTNWVSTYEYHQDDYVYDDGYAPSSWQGGILYKSLTQNTGSKPNANQNDWLKVQDSNTADVTMSTEDSWQPNYVSLDTPYNGAFQFVGLTIEGGMGTGCRAYTERGTPGYKQTGQTTTWQAADEYTAGQYVYTPPDASVPHTGLLYTAGVDNGGSGYTSAPTVTMDPPSLVVPRQCTVTPVVSASTGKITDITINDGGAGYLSSPTITIEIPPVALYSEENTSATGIRATATTVIGSGVVTEIKITDVGAGYVTTPAPAISVDAPPQIDTATATANVTNGKVTGFTLTNPGSGYGFNPTVTITGGGGSGASALSYIDPVSGVVTAILLNDKGISGAEPTHTGGAQTTTGGTVIWSYVGQLSRDIITFNVSQQGLAYSTNPSVVAEIDDAAKTHMTTFNTDNEIVQNATPIPDTIYDMVPHIYGKNSDLVDRVWQDTTGAPLSTNSGAAAVIQFKTAGLTTPVDQGAGKQIGMGQFGYTQPGGAPNYTDISFAANHAQALFYAHARLSNYKVSRTDGTVLNSLLESFLGSEMLDILENGEEYVADEITQTPIYDYCGNIIGYNNVAASGVIYSRTGEATSLTTDASLTGSDRRIKEDLRVIHDPIEKILSLNGYHFYNTNSGRQEIGLIAQEVEEVIPELVHTLQHTEFQDGLKVLNYGNIAGLLVEGIKKQNDRIEYLESKLEMLEKQGKI